MKLEDLDAIIAGRCSNTIPAIPNCRVAMCSLCGEEVYLSPSSIAIKKQCEDLPVWCVECGAEKAKEQEKQSDAGQD